MKRIIFRINTGCQPYLYDCYILPDAGRPIEIFHNNFFGELVCCLSALVDPREYCSLTEQEFAEHLLAIAKTSTYTFEVQWDEDDVEHLLRELINNAYKSLI